MREDEIYIATKEFLNNAGWEIVGGQPPRGTDRYPVIEIKSDTNSSRGSKGSFKPDLIARRDRYLLLCECKPYFDPSDVEKLHSVLESTTRVELLRTEMAQRNIGVAGSKLVAVVSFSGTNRLLDELVGAIAFSDAGAIVSPASCWTDELQSLFELI